MKREAGTGTVEPMPSGRFRAKATLPDGVRHSLGTYETEEEAEGVIAAAVLRAQSVRLERVGGATIAGWGPSWLEELKQSKSYVAMPNARSIFKHRISAAPFAAWPLRRVTARAIRAWVAALLRTELSLSSVRQSLTVLRKMLDGAVELGMLDVNPAREVRVPRQPAATSEPWAYLLPEEQHRLLSCEAIPHAWRLSIAFAMGTGLRQGEQWSLHLADLHLDGPAPYASVRFGSRERAPKGRKSRKVPLLPLALDALRQWLTILPTFAKRNPNGLVFPGPSGGFQKVSRVPGWAGWLKSAGIERRVRWHDLRHTCGASLVSGWWGRAWRLEEVRELLGHHAISMTERYAHLGESALTKAASETLDCPRVVLVDADAAKNGSEVAVGLNPRHSPRTSSNEPEIKDFPTSLDDARTIALQLVRAARRREDTRELEARVSAAVLGSPIVRLALAVAAGGPHATDRALDLAELILSDEPRAMLGGALPSAAQAEPSGPVGVSRG